jgi:hypothetical protein
MNVVLELGTKGLIMPFDPRFVDRAHVAHLEDCQGFTVPQLGTCSEVELRTLIQLVSDYRPARGELYVGILEIPQLPKELSFCKVDIQPEGATLQAVEIANNLDNSDTELTHQFAKAVKAIRRAGLVPYLIQHLAQPGNVWLGTKRAA